MKALAAEALGTFAYVAAILSVALLGGGPVHGMAVAIAAGLTYVAMCYALGGVSGCHFNPALTLGLVAAGRFETRNAVPYAAAQVLGGVAAAACVYALISAAPDKSALAIATVANRFGTETTFPFAAVLACEAIAAMFILLLFVGATSSGVPAGFAPIGMGLLIVVLHLALAPISQAALNPARATATALFADQVALLQLWVFWVAPIIGGVAGGLIARWFNEDS